MLRRCQQGKHMIVLVPVNRLGQGICQLISEYSDFCTQKG